jgi:hypothetical protein
VTIVTSATGPIHDKRVGSDPIRTRRDFMRCPWSVLRLAAAAFLLAALPGAARAACDCATSGVAPYCSGNSVTVSSGRGGSPTDTLSVQFDTSYQCGQYATGDFWVAGQGSPKVVRVTRTTPDWDGNRNGWDANRPFDQQHLDRRVPEFVGAPTLPSGGYNVGSGPVSFMKAIGRNTVNSSIPYQCDNGSTRETCVKFTAVVTFVPAPPDSDGDGRTDDEFRPGSTGTTKLGPYRVDMLQARVDALPGLSASSAPGRDDFSFAEIYDRYGHGCAITYLSGGVFQQIAPSDCYERGSVSTNGNPVYGNTIAVNNRVAPLRFLLSDFNWSNPTHRGALLAYVQHGIDIGQDVSGGWRSRAASRPIGNGYLAPGGIAVGHKSPVVFAAYMLQTPALSLVAQGNYYFESDQVYRSPVDNRVYYGVGIAGTNPYCPDDGTGIEGSIHCYHPSKRMDASCAGSGKSYQSQVTNSAPYAALWVQILGAQASWNDSPWLEYSRAWKEGGRAPGHLHYLWSNGLSTNGCDNQRWNTGYENGFGEQMWAAFKNVQAGSTPPPPPPPPPTESPLPAPDQLLN